MDEADEEGAGQRVGATGLAKAQGGNDDLSLAVVRLGGDGGFIAEPAAECSHQDVARVESVQRGDDSRRGAGDERGAHQGFGEQAVPKRGRYPVEAGGPVRTETAGAGNRGQEGRVGEVGDDQGW